MERNSEARRGSASRGIKVDPSNLIKSGYSWFYPACPWTRGGFASFKIVSVLVVNEFLEQRRGPPLT
jgi:hypothetical protein